MSGSNGVQRWAKTNREDELVPLRSRGPTFYGFQYQIISTTQTPSTNPNPTTLTADQMFENLSFDAGTINPISAPVFNTLVSSALSRNGLLQNGYSWTVYYQNTNPNTGSQYGPISASGSITITYPNDWSISGTVSNTLTIGPGVTLPVTYVIQSVGPPVVVRVMTGSPQSSGGRNPYFFDKGVTIRPSNNDPLINTFSVVQDTPLADNPAGFAGQHMVYLISNSSNFATGVLGAINSMVYMRVSDAATDNNDFWIFCSPAALPLGSANFSVRMDGQVFAPVYNIVSDSTQKSDIVPITSTLPDGYGIIPYQFRYNWEPVGTKHFGFLADQIDLSASLVPLVTQGPGYASLDTNGVVAVHQQLIKDLNTRLNTLISELKAAPNNLTLP